MLHDDFKIVEDYNFGYPHYPNNKTYLYLHKIPSNCQLICIPYDISNVRHYTNAIQKYQIMRIIEVGRNHKSLPLSSYCCYQHVILMLMSRDCPNSFTRTSIM